MTPAQKLAKISAIYETIELDKNGLKVTNHAGYNLSGVILDIEAKGECDKIALRTLKRVRNQLAEIAKVLGI